MLDQTHTLRKLLPADLPEFIRLRKEGLEQEPTAFGMSAKEFENFPVEFHESLFDKKFQGFLLGAFRGETLVGLLVVEAKRGEKREHIAVLWGFYIATSERGQGLGKKLLTQAIEEAKEIPKLRQLQLSVQSENTVAIALYNKLAFQIWGKEFNALLHGEKFYDEVHMNRDL